MSNKILQIITLSECGGAQTHLLELIKGMKQEFDFCVLTGQEGFLTDELTKLKCAYEIIPSLQREINPQKDYLAYQEIKAAIKRLKPQLIHCHSSKAGILGRLAAASYKLPAIYTAHGWGFHPNIKLSQRLIALYSEAICACLSRKIICVSEFDRQMAINTKLFPPSLLQTIHNGIPSLSRKEIQTEVRRGKFNGDSAKPLSDGSSICNILMVGRFSKPKRQDLLIEAFAALPLAIKQKAQLFFAGDHSGDKRCKDLCDIYKLNDKVQFLGQVYPIMPLLSSSHVLVLISDHEGLPMSLIEGMREGLPLLASSVGGNPEVIREGINGFLVSNSVQAISSALIQLIENPNLRDRMGKASLEIFESNFTANKMLSSTNEVYVQILCDLDLSPERRNWLLENASDSDLDLLTDGE